MRVVDQRSVGLNSGPYIIGERGNRSQDIINLAYDIIIEPSESEWPQGSRASRHPSFAGPLIDEGTMLAAAQSLALTKTQAALFLALVRRKFCTNEILHGIFASRRRTHSTPTDRKIVSVMIHNIRKRLRGRYTIQTVQGSGYFIPDDDRRRAAKHLLGCIEVAVDDAAVKKLTGNLKLPAAEQGDSKEACGVRRPGQYA
jgi:hypothetical protein